MIYVALFPRASYGNSLDTSSDISLAKGRLRAGTSAITRMVCHSVGCNLLYRQYAITQEADRRAQVLKQSFPPRRNGRSRPRR